MSMDYGSVEDNLVRVKKAKEKLETEKVLHCDEIRALKAEVRSYQDELARTKTSYEDEIARLREEIEYREERRLVRRSEIRAFKAEVRSYQDEIGRLEAIRLRQDEEIRSLEVKVRSHQDELGQARNEIGRLEAERLSQQEESRALEVEELQKTLVRDIGKKVRLRYLEKHRQQMGQHIGPSGKKRINEGNKAAHRGRPVVDALLCLTGEIRDPEVYPNLYGVRPEIMKEWKDVGEIVKVAGFRASLQSEGRLTEEFQTHFESLLKIARSYRSSPELTTAFRENKDLQQLHVKVECCYDKIDVNRRPGASLGSNFSVLSL